MAEASTTSTAPVRRKRSAAEKRQIVEETYREGASVRSVARTYDIPSNQLFHWRKLYREGLLGNQAEQATQSKLVAVRLVDEQQRSTRQQHIDVDQAPHPSATTASLGTIQIETEKGRLCICGAADPAILQLVLERWLG
jgi:transposase